MPWLKMDSQRQEVSQFKARLWWALLLIVLVFVGLISRLIYLQVIQHEHYVTQSDNNRQQLQALAPTRGLIYDTNGVLLAGNRASHSLTLVPERLIKGHKGIDSMLTELAEVVTIDQDDIKRFKRRLNQPRRPFSPVTLRFQLNPTEIAQITVNQHRLPGVRIVPELVRYYPMDDGFVHALGYVGRINDRELAKLDSVNYSATHHVGKLGVERFYENELHGTVGHQTVETNARGRVLQVLERFEPVPGKDITLFLNAQLQQAAVKLLEGKRGAIVAIDPSTGGVLAMASAPTYGANQFVTGISNANYQALRNSDDLPLFNRALRGRYPPASTVKPVIALAGMDTGLVPRNYSLWDPGYYQLTEGGRFYRDWKEGGHGRVDMHKSIVESVDTYYYAIAHLMGNDPMTKYLAKFGFGQVTIADQPEATKAVLPTKQWKRINRNASWFPGDSLNLGIGQGFLSATPTQIASMAMVLANKGQWHQVRMIKAINGQAVTKVSDIGRNDPKQPIDIKLKRNSDWDGVHNAMIDVMHGAKGTGRRSGANSSYKMAGKTGTAQVLGIKQDSTYDADKIAERFRDHGLYIGWAPVDNPKIAIAVIIENGGGGSSAAAPLARKLFDLYVLEPKPEVKSEDNVGGS
ncbi:penicillin-binding protein 2 [Oceanospirillaceae bacterium]|nr:penicillin-binding protein 2 [Oceanospirillaceae bacterium]